MESLQHLYKIAARFSIAGAVQSISALGEGNVNNTYLVETNGQNKNKYVLQQINQEVFKNPDLIALNLIKISEYLSLRDDQAIDHSVSRWEIPTLVACTNSSHLHKDSSNSVWRMTTFLDNSVSYQQVDSTHLAKETGKALGKFHAMLLDLDENQLYDTLPGFHNTPLHLKQFEQARLKGLRSVDNPDMNYCIQFIENRRHTVKALISPGKGGLLSKGITHGDPKINNVLFDKTSNYAIGMIDLDTVKPGLILHDIGDCLRSCCNGEGEESQNLDRVKFNLDFAKELMKGYLESAINILSLKDKSMLYDAVRLLAFELGLRFFTDYLKGDIYFKTTYENQNLNRSMVQFKLTEDIERKENSIKKLLKS